MDITNGINSCLTLLINIFTNLFNKLDSIQIWGTTLLNIYINITIIGVMIPIIITIANSRAISRGVNAYERKKANKQRE